jgi:hypothetical protein
VEACISGALAAAEEKLGRPVEVKALGITNQVGSGGGPPLVNGRRRLGTGGWVLS